MAFKKKNFRRAATATVADDTVATPSDEAVPMVTEEKKAAPAIKKAVKPQSLLSFGDDEEEDAFQVCVNVGTVFMFCGLLSTLVGCAMCVVYDL